MEVNRCAVLYRPGDVALQVELGRHNDRNVVRFPNVGAPFPHGFFCFSLRMNQVVSSCSVGMSLV